MYAALLYVVYLGNHWRVMLKKAEIYSEMNILTCGFSQGSDSTNSTLFNDKLTLTHSDYRS